MPRRGVTLRKPRKTRKKPERKIETEVIEELTPAESLKESLKERESISALEEMVERLETRLKLQEDITRPKEPPVRAAEIPIRTVELPKERKEISTGIIVSQDPNGLYQVQVGQRQLAIKSAVPGTLAPKTNVILADTEKGFFIVGTEKLKDRVRRTVVITG